MLPKTHHRPTDHPDMNCDESFAAVGKRCALIANMRSSPLLSSSSWGAHVRYNRRKQASGTRHDSYAVLPLLRAILRVRNKYFALKFRMNRGQRKEKKVKNYSTLRV